MDKVTISLPETMNDYIKSRIASGQYGNVSEFFRDLVRRDQNRKQAEQDLRAQIQHGLDSGISNKSPEDIRQNVQARLRKNGQL